jgi:hypothetical protein
MGAEYVQIPLVLQSLSNFYYHTLQLADRYFHPLAVVLLSPSMLQNVTTESLTHSPRCSIGKDRSATELVSISSLLD